MIPILARIMTKTAFMKSPQGQVRNLYEAERAKTHALVQQLVDALEATKHKPDWWRHHPSEEWIYDVIADAAEQGFKPFQP